MTQLSDELLIAYVDGQLDRPQAAAVGRLLREDYEIASRVQRLQQTQARLMETFGALLKNGQSEPVEPAVILPLREAEPEALLSQYRLAFIAAALFVLAALVTYAASRFGSSEPETPKIAERLGNAEISSAWQAEVARLHSFFSRDTLTQTPTSLANRDLIAMQLSNFIRRPTPLQVPDFSKQGLTLSRSQILNYQGSRFMQIIYMGKEEQPVGLYIMSGGATAPMTEGSFGTVHTVNWSTNDVQFVLAGSLAKEAMKALAVVAQNQLSRAQ